VFRSFNIPFLVCGPIGNFFECLNRSCVSISESLNKTLPPSDLLCVLFLPTRFFRFFRGFLLCFHLAVPPSLPCCPDCISFWFFFHSFWPVDPSCLVFFTPLNFLFPNVLFFLTTFSVLLSFVGFLRDLAVFGLPNVCLFCYLPRSVPKGLRV